MNRDTYITVCICIGKWWCNFWFMVQWGCTLGSSEENGVKVTMHHVPFPRAIYSDGTDSTSSNWILKYISSSTHVPNLHYLFMESIISHIYFHKLCMKLHNLTPFLQAVIKWLKHIEYATPEIAFWWLCTMSSLSPGGTTSCNTATWSVARTSCWLIGLKWAAVCLCV